MDELKINITRSLLPLALMSCGEQTENTGYQDMLARKIESTITLPDDAYEMEQYARVYFLASNDEVHARYIRNFDNALKPDETCEQEVLLNNGESTTRPVPCPEFLYEKPQFQTDQSVWVDDETEFPGIDDGGCILVSIIYDLKTNSFKSVSCNGQA
ncbi:hypothetical protein [Alterisphingorhabdus coralli]|uniref:Uncharacterized protein n=1 Tax=Alterisphingorhabdus coralli TaxID=3071408 RepID=A0AA97I1I3_9SPHN|nr:hypothetical protein [Parasphingorhabdus sp. SCSIO 66989]WOE75423.1 hypothetical protein RB602_01530 [Parasphingorhabdus sp. SCSIO 66989]